MLKLRQAHLANEHRAETLAAEVRRATADILDRERETITRLSRAAEFRDPRPAPTSSACRTIRP